MYASMNEVQSTRERIFIAGVFIFFTLFLMISFYTVYDQPWVDKEASKSVDILESAPGQNVSIEEVTKDPESFVGRVVSVRGLVIQTIGTRGITVENSAKDTGELLVISRESLMGVGSGTGKGTYDENEGIRASGVVRIFNIEQLESEVGFPLNEDAYKGYEGKPVIIADSINPLQNVE